MSTPAAALHALVPRTIVAFPGANFQTIGIVFPNVRERKFVISSAANCTGPPAPGAIATSIDALSVGFTIAEYDLVFALAESVIIGIVTFGICMAGITLGEKIGTKLSGKATIFGGIILILIGIEIFVTGII